MKAAVYWGGGAPLRIEEVSLDAPAAREVVVRTVASGVCHSDVHRVEWSDDADVPRILGHEASGIVEAVGDAVTYVTAGDHVVVCTSAFCGSCESCLTGHPNRCDKSRTGRSASAPPRISKEGQRVNTLVGVGSFAEQMLLHENGVVKIRSDMPLEQAALLGCSVIAGVGSVLRTARIEPGCVVAVFGCGGVGLNAVQGARIGGARQIIAIDTVPAKLEKAVELGATHTIDASQDDVVKRVRAMAWSEGGVDYAFEAIGIPSVIEQAFASLRPGGVATVIGITRENERITLDPRLLLGERKLQGSVMGSNRFRIDLPQYVDLYLQGRLKLDEMISRRYRLQEINDAFAALLAGTDTRGVVVFE